MKPKITAVMPVYNTGNTLYKSVRSIINNIDELIIINDNSTDDSLKRIRYIIKIYERRKNIKLINLKKNVGANNAKTIGFKNASYDYVLILDSDIILNKHFIDEAIKDLNEGYLWVCSRLETEEITLSHKLMSCLRAISHSFIDGASMIRRKTIYKYSKNLNVTELNKNIKNSGKKITNIYSLHLGEPHSFEKLIKRQWIYPRQHFKIFRKKYTSFSGIIMNLFYISPFAMLISIPLYKIAFKRYKHFFRDPGFLFLIPIAVWIFYLVHALSVLYSIMIGGSDV